MSKKCQIPPITSQIFLESTSSSPTCFVCPGSGLIPRAWKTRSPLLLPGSRPPIPAAVVPGTTCVTIRQDYLSLISPSSTLSPSLLSSDLTYICLLRHLSPLVSPLDHQVGSVASPAQASLTMLQYLFRAHLHGQASGGHDESSSSEGLEDVWEGQPQGRTSQDSECTKILALTSHHRTPGHARARGTSCSWLILHLWAGLFIFSLSKHQ